MPFDRDDERRGDFGDPLQDVRDLAAVHSLLANAAAWATLPITDNRRQVYDRLVPLHSRLIDRVASD